MSAKLIPERLKFVRENMGITMAEASRRLNLSKIGYCRYEYGERVPSQQTLEIIAQCFNTSVEYLTGLSDSPAATQIVIDKNKNPELFALVDLCQNKDTELLQRMLSYCTRGQVRRSTSPLYQARALARGMRTRRQRDT